MKLLLPFSWLYAAVMLARNTLFDWGVLKSERVKVPVISVGNMTVGGTGKTPLVEYLVKYLLQKEKQVAVVSRGYKRKSSGVVVVSDGKRMLENAERGGDEPVQIAEKFPGAIVVVGEKRVEAAKRSVELGADVIVLDDGFQHRYIQRDVDIVVLDATASLTSDSVLPVGRLREPLSGLRRASVVAFSKVADSAASTFKLDSEIRPYFSGPTIKYRYRIASVRRASDNGSASVDVVRTMRLLAFSGIGKHETFIGELASNSFNVMSDLRFSDHHLYEQTDTTAIAAVAKAMSADACITTEKDVVRLRSNMDITRQLFDEIPVFYLTIEVDILEGGDTFVAHIDNCIRKTQA